MVRKGDRNFDELAERFSRKVYGGLKGEIRLSVLWRDLQAVLDKLENTQSEPLRVLDIGAGFGQLALRLAAQGHQVTINDLSPVMLENGRQLAREQGVENQIEWLPGAYQDLPDGLYGKFDIVLCHAVLEWLDAPQQAVPILKRFVKPQGYLSLCFYNPAAKIYRNLICGNFRSLQLEKPYQSDKGSLTPNHPCSVDEVREWLAQSGFIIESATGLRVFHDYVIDKRGGHQSAEAVLAMELAYSGQEPFKWLGRYLHFLALNSTSLNT